MVITYWDDQYTGPDLRHHVWQNRRLSRDFLRHARRSPHFQAALHADRIVEVGCGTGELAARVQHYHDTSVYIATDASRAAVRTAMRRHPVCHFLVYDILNDPPCGRFDTCISSNTLEHFQDWPDVIGRMFQLASRLIVLVPHGQQILDHYEGEGGAGHAASFTRQSFKPYGLRDFLIFETAGWQHQDSVPAQQLAVLLEQEPERESEEPADLPRLLAAAGERSDREQESDDEADDGSDQEQAA